MSFVEKSIRFFQSDLGLRFIAEAAARGSGFIITPLLAWTLGSAVFGGYTQILSLSFAFVPFVSLGLGYTVIRKIAGEHNNEHASFLLFYSVSVVSFICLLLAGFLQLAQSYISSLFPIGIADDHSLVILVVSFLTWAVATETLVQEYFRARKWVRGSLVLQLSVLVWHLICLIAVVLLGHLSIWSAFAILIFAKLSVIAAVLFALFRSRPKRYERSVIPDRWKVLSAGLPFMLAGFAEWSANLGDRLLVGKYLGPEQVAQYTAAVMLLSVVVAIGAPLWWLLFPELVKYRQEENYQLCLHIVQKRTMTFTRLALPALFLIFLIADPAISLLVNSNATDISIVVAILGAGVFVNQFATGWEYYIASASSGKRLMVATIMSALIGFAVAIYLGTVWGMVGVALGALTGKVCLAAIYAVLANKVGFPGVVWKTATFATVMAVNLAAFAITNTLLLLVDFENPAIKIIGITSLFGASYTVLHLAYAKFSRVAR